MFRVATLFAALSLAAPAHATVYDCKINADSGDQGWISKDYVFDHDSTANSVSVVDNVIQYFLKKPLAGKVSDDTSRKLVFFLDGSGQGRQGKSLCHAVSRRMVQRPENHDRHGDPAGVCKQFRCTGNLHGQVIIGVRSCYLPVSGLSDLTLCAAGTLSAAYHSLPTERKSHGFHPSRSSLCP